MHSNLIYALKNNQIVSIDDVESGLKCDCLCPACGNKLIAKKGNRVMHHFAHYSETNCEYGYETSLHLAAKDILSKAKKMMLPPVRMPPQYSHREDSLLQEAKEITIENVFLEKRFQGFIPDIVVCSGGKQLFVEIFVTHKIDEAKKKKLEDANISTIEIDLSKKDKLISAAELTELLLGDVQEKRWIYNAYANKQMNRLFQRADSLRIEQHGFAMHVMECPINQREWHGIAYANLTHDCYGCSYFVDESDEHVLCTGRTGISCLADLNTDTTTLINRRNVAIQQERNTCIDDGYCPRCGGRLQLRESAYGVFFGCGNYPHCKYTISIDQETGEVCRKNSI